MSYSSAQVRNILTAAAKHGFIIVGGQAINGWSEELQIPKREPWLSLSPYTSHDIDCYAELRHLPSLVKEMESMGFSVEVHLPQNKAESKHNIAVLWVKGNDLNLEINCLRDVIGISTAELKNTVQEFATSDGFYFLMHPLLCMESKTHNLAYLPQDGRQDEKHLRLSIANLHSYLLRLDDATVCQQIVDRVLEIAFSPHGIQIYRNYNIHFLQAVPWEEWNHSLNPDLKKIALQYSQHRTHLKKLIEEELETEEWLSNLNPYDHKEVTPIGVLSRYPHLS